LFIKDKCDFHLNLVELGFLIDNFYLKSNPVQKHPVLRLSFFRLVAKKKKEKK